MTGYGFLLGLLLLLPALATTSNSHNYVHINDLEGLVAAFPENTQAELSSKVNILRELKALHSAKLKELHSPYVGNENTSSYASRREFQTKIHSRDSTVPPRLRDFRPDGDLPNAFLADVPFPVVDFEKGQEFVASKRSLQQDYSLCDSYLRFPVNTEDQAFWDAYGSATENGWGLYYTTEGTPLYMLTSPSCMAAMQTLICAKNVQKVTYTDNWSSGSHRSNPQPVCRSVCEEAYNQCANTADLSSGPWSYLVNEKIAGSSLADAHNWYWQLFAHPTQEYNAYSDPSLLLYDPDTFVPNVCLAYPSEDEEDCFSWTGGEEDLPGAAVVSLTVPLASTGQIISTDLSAASEILLSALGDMASDVVLNPSEPVDGTMDAVVVPSHTSALDSTTVAEAMATADMVAFVSALVAANYTCTDESSCVNGAVSITTADTTQYASSVPQTEVDALVSLYDQCNGPSWTRQRRWNVGDVCSWEGVTCDYAYECTSFYCSWESYPNQAHVLSLDLSDNNLVCDEIPSLSALTELRTIDLGYNRFTQLPEERPFSTTLEELQIYESGIIQAVPSWLAELTSLRVLNIAMKRMRDSYFPHGTFVPLHAVNKFSGNLDFLADYTQIEELRMYNQDFSSETDVSKLCAHTTLRIIDIDYTKIGGVIPACFGELVNLEHLWMMQNNFYSTIPPELGSMQSLTHIALAGNALYGTVPPEVACMDYGIITEFIVGAESWVSSTIPECIGNLGPSTQILSMYASGIYGTIPESFNNLTGCWFLALSSSGLGGPLTDLGGMSKLAQLFLEDVGFDSEFPLWIRNLQELQVLAITNQNLHGTIPEVCTTEELSNGTCASLLPNFQNLNIGGNALSGTIPAGWQHLNLRLLDVSYNNLTSLGEAVCDMEDLFYLSFAGNGIEGELPACLATVRGLETLNLENNHFEGTVPESYGWEWNSMSTFLLGYNQLSGSLPEGLSQMRNARRIDLSVNQFSGQISNAMDLFKDLEFLTTLSLSDNNFSGPLRADLFVDANKIFFEQLMVLTVSKNLISGTVPQHLSKLPRLSTLDLRQNLDLTGYFPSSFGRLGALFATDTNTHDPNDQIPTFANVRTSVGWSKILNSAYSCPQLEGPDSTKVVELDPYYYGQSLCKCDVGYYGFPDDDIGCQDCVEGASCPGGTQEDREAPLLFPQGKYPSPPIYAKMPGEFVEDTHTYYYEDSYTLEELWSVPECTQAERDDDGGDETYKCIKTYSRVPEALADCYLQSKGDHVCLGTPEDDPYSTIQCKDGHHGRLCSECDSGYYESGRKCLKCPSDSTVYAVFFIVVVLVVLFLFFLVLKNATLIRLLVTLKSLLFFLQTMDILFSKMMFHWPATLLSFDDVYQYANFSLSLLRCVFGELDYGTNYVLLTLSVFWIMLLSLGFVVLGWLYIRFYRADLSPKDASAFFVIHIQKCVHLFFYLVNVFYLPVTVRIFGVFNCAQDPAEKDENGDPISYLVFAPYFSCSGDRYNVWIALAVMNVIVFLIGIPALFSTVLWKFRARLSEIRAVFSFLYHPYKPEYYWYELAIFMRRLIIAVSVTMFSPDSSFTFFLIILLLAAALGMQAYVSPYRYEIVNQLETIALGIVNVTFVCGLIFTSEVVDDTNHTLDVLEVILIIANVAILFAFFLVACDIVFGISRFFEHIRVLQWLIRMLRSDVYDVEEDDDEDDHISTEKSDGTRAEGKDFSALNGTFEKEREPFVESQSTTSGDLRKVTSASVVSNPSEENIFDTAWVKNIYITEI